MLVPPPQQLEEASVSTTNPSNAPANTTPPAKSRTMNNRPMIFGVAQKFLTISKMPLYSRHRRVSRFVFMTTTAYANQCSAYQCPIYFQKFYQSSRFLMFSLWLLKQRCIQFSVQGGTRYPTLTKELTFHMLYNMIRDFNAINVAVILHICLSNNSSTLGGFAVR